MGSGAFLVQTCRYLSEKLVEAWENVERELNGQREQNDQLRKPQITPEGQLSQGQLTRRTGTPRPEERLAVARRLVSERCLYGVDKNPMAVEMAKLSLWLITLAKNKPFTFLDHNLRCGDSLLGVNERQLYNGSLDAKPGETTQSRQDQLRHSVRAPNGHPEAPTDRHCFPTSTSRPSSKKNACSKKPIRPWKSSNSAQICSSALPSATPNAAKVLKAHSAWSTPC